MALFSLPGFLKGYYSSENRVSDDNPPFGWYKSIFRSYFAMVVKPVGIVLSIGQQSMDRGYALKRHLGNLFSGSEMRTTGSTYMSVTLTDDVLIIAFDPEGRDFSSSTRHSEPSRLLSFKVVTSTFNRLNPFGPDSPSAGSSPSGALGHLGSPLTSPFGRVLNMMPLGRSKNEDRAPAAQAAPRAEPVESIQRLYMCGICFEETPDDSIARPDPCGHTFCRECLRGHVTTCLEEHRFPILCPTCTAGKGKGKAAAGEISQSLALDLGLNEEQYGIWIEMEMASFSVLLHCRKCQRTMFVAKDEHEEIRVITCPLPDCNHTWCKQCQQSVDRSGPKHSCDGTLELDYLMKQQGWKYCPTCKTPIQKVSGCNHMSCRTPACNTHFCYRCGVLMWRSGSGMVEEISAHLEKDCTPSL